jgi:hypothetical protein
MRLTGRTVALCAIVFSTLLSLANAVSWGSDDVEVAPVPLVHSETLTVGRSSMFGTSS